MGAVRLSSIRVTPLSRIPVTGGDVLHALKATETDFNGFGEAYFSTVKPSYVKAWKRHLRMTMNLVVPVGMVRFVFLDRESGAVREEVIGIERYLRISVPPGIWFGFQGAGEHDSLVLNISSIPHDPDEVERLPVSAIEYEWL